MYYIGVGAKVPDMAICFLFFFLVSGDNRLL